MVVISILDRFLSNSKTKFMDALRFPSGVYIYAPELYIEYVETIEEEKKSEILQLCSRLKPTIIEPNIGGIKSKCVLNIGGAGLKRYIVMDLFFSEKADFESKWSYGGREFRGRVLGEYSYVVSVRLDMITGYMSSVLGIKMSLIPKIVFESPQRDISMQQRFISYSLLCSRENIIDKLREMMDKIFAWIIDILKGKVKA